MSRCFCPCNATTELQTLMGQERDFTRNVQRKHLQLLSAGNSDKAEELVLMAQTQLHAITQFTGVVRHALLHGGIAAWCFGRRRAASRERQGLLCPGSLACAS